MSSSAAVAVAVAAGNFLSHPTSTAANTGWPPTIAIAEARLRPRTDSSYILSASTSFQMRNKWRTAFALNTGSSPNGNGQDNVDAESTGLGRTRLGIIVRAAAVQLLEKLNTTRKNFPMKIFLLLLGFYTANALATILGQTGDWDVLVAGVVVAAIEGIGMLMYGKRFQMALRRFQSFVSMVNYWKAGVCLGLFVDAFKLGS